MRPFGRRKRAITIANRPLPDEEAMRLVRAGVLRPHEAPSAVLRDLLKRQARQRRLTQRPDSR